MKSVNCNVWFLGRQYDKDGNIFQWWSDEDIVNFQDKAKCIIDQYSNYTVEINGKEQNASEAVYSL